MISYMLFITTQLLLFLFIYWVVSNVLKYKYTLKKSSVLLEIMMTVGKLYVILSAVIVIMYQVDMLLIDYHMVNPICKEILDDFISSVILYYK